MSSYDLIPGYTGVIGSWAIRPPVMPDDPRDAIPGLCAFAAQAHAKLTHAWGEPARLMARRTMPYTPHRHALVWLKYLEAFVRRIILILALSLTPAPVRPRKGEAKALPAWRSTSPHDPASWRVSFRPLRVLKVRDGAASASEPAPPSPPSEMQRDRYRPVSARALARRIEAVWRALKWPHGPARRLARLLARMRAAEKAGGPLAHIRLKRWTCDRDTANPAQRAVAAQMPLADALAERALGVWHTRPPEPG